MNASEIIDALGGTTKVAKLCDVRPAAVSQWRTSKGGIPKPQLRFLRLAKPAIFKAANAKAKEISAAPH